MMHSRQLANPPMNACDTILPANTGGLLVLLLGEEGQPNYTTMFQLMFCYVLHR